MTAADLGAFRSAVAIFVIALATIAGAWSFEAMGYAPCELCLAQRWPYYAAVPLAGLAVLVAWRGCRLATVTAFAGLALVFAASAIFGAYHSGVEWGFWPGPSACSGALAPADSVTDFLAQLEQAPVVRCDAPALRILGLSLAGWNALVSAAACGLAVRGLVVSGLAAARR